MQQFTYWQEADGTYLGYLTDYPNYMTQGSSFEELKSMLCDIIDAIRAGDLVDTASNHQRGTLVHA